MSKSILKRTLVIISIVGTVISAGHRSTALPVSPFIARAQEALEETAAQQFARDEIARRRNELRSVFEAKRNEFTEQLSGISNEGKRQMALRISDSINEINTRKTDQYLGLIGRIDSILQKISARMEEAGQKGANVSEIWPKVQDANRIIAEARGLVMSQAGVIYNIDGTTEEGLSPEALSARNNLYNDIGNIRTRVKEAWNAVAEVIRAFNSANKQ
jgi:hypothetical protein